jgi:hydrogenase maturation protein HypF
MGGKRLLIRVGGIVQGVGFRPYVYRLGREMGLKGFVKNTSDGVLIDAEGERVEELIHRLQAEAPPLSSITGVECEIMPFAGYSDFRIAESGIVEKDKGGKFSLVSPDVSVCADCLAELFDENDRRHLYPFINCTNCGPRYSIIRRLPYDRPETTMNVFRMCPECEREYRDPANRRFHAEPNACPACGPSLTFVSTDGAVVTAQMDIFSQLFRLLSGGKTVAIKGLGGFHLACDAEDEGAVRALRERKRRSRKPFALMACDAETVRQFCNVSAGEEALLLSEKRPVVLLEKKSPFALPEDISPNNRRAGFMLPYTPLHWLLFRHPGSPFRVLVMTSGNLSEEPIVTDNEEALSKLSGLADGFILHDRDIHTRVDDSVAVFSDGGKKHLVRRARGYAPEAIMLSSDGPEVMGAGADLKNTFTLTKGNAAILSQHIGDMENPNSLVFYEETLERLKALYRVRPEAIAHDLHPGYHSTSWTMKQDFAHKIGIQHHYAHIASVMAERGMKGKCIGVAFDGTGYGADGTLWGGEFLIADIDGFVRTGHIKPFPLPGGEEAIKNPWRVAVSLIREFADSEAMAYCEKAGLTMRHEPEDIERTIGLCGKDAFSPVSSGAGRLFDGVSALLGLVDRNTFEGEAAMALESITLRGFDGDYPVDVIFKKPLEIDFSMTILAIVKDMHSGVPPAIISTKFHNTVAEAVSRAAVKLSDLAGIGDIVLSGGVFQNMYLLDRAMSKLSEKGRRVFANEKVPANDAGISLGQAYILRERLKG